jgi:hypothetical protein
MNRHLQAVLLDQPLHNFVHSELSIELREFRPPCRRDAPTAIVPPFSTPDDHTATSIFKW